MVLMLCYNLKCIVSVSRAQTTEYDYDPKAHELIHNVQKLFKMCLNCKSDIPREQYRYLTNSVVWFLHYEFLGSC